jgi:hypothetical protein
MTNKEKAETGYAFHPALPDSATAASTVDKALVYLQLHNERALTDEASLKSIRWKVDWNIFPAMLVIHLMQNLDKFSLNVSHSFRTQVCVTEESSSMPPSWAC